MKNYKFYIGCYKSPKDERDFLISPLVADIIDRLPSNIDYTDEMSPIRNQGSEGSCVGHAGVAVKEWMEKKDYGKFIDLSERFLYEESKKISGHKEGTTLKACAKVLVNYGVCEEKYWKYIAKEVGKPKAGAYTNAEKYCVEPAYVRITNEQELKASMVKYGVLLIGVLVYRNWYEEKEGHIPNLNWWQSLLAKFGFYSPLGGHAICLVGYNDNTQEYKFKNSWGEGWGNKGYGFISYKHMKEILMDAIQMVDIDDPEEFAINLMTVADLPNEEIKHAWI